jgi:hypothetical protein
MPKENSAMKPVWKISSGKTDGSPTENQSAVDDLDEHFILGVLSEKQNRSLLTKPCHCASFPNRHKKSHAVSAAFFYKI